MAVVTSTYYILLGCDSKVISKCRQTTQCHVPEYSNLKFYIGVDSVFPESEILSEKCICLFNASNILERDVCYLIIIIIIIIIIILCKIWQ
jgi:hypothetical protein